MSCKTKVCSHKVARNIRLKKAYKGDIIENHEHTTYCVNIIFSKRLVLTNATCKVNY